MTKPITNREGKEEFDRLHEEKLRELERKHAAFDVQRDEQLKICVNCARKSYSPCKVMYKGGWVKGIDGEWYCRKCRNVYEELLYDRRQIAG